MEEPEVVNRRHLVLVLLGMNFRLSLPNFRRNMRFDTNMQVNQDLGFYGFTMNASQILNAIGYSDGTNFYDTIYRQAVGTIILTCAGALPGYLAAIFAIDTVGRKPMQIIGFLVLTILFGVLGFTMHQLTTTATMAICIFCQFVFSAGPNTTTFLISAECFPTRYRATAYGLAAGTGKLGAVLAQIVSIPLLYKDMPEDVVLDCPSALCSPWLDRLMQIFALFMFLGVLSSFLIKETTGHTLEELSGEPPTSYNAGRNGSIGQVGKNRWNPFGGGKPAGFLYPRVQVGAFGARKSSRVGIMTPPEMLSEAGPQRKRHIWRKSQKLRLGSDSTDDYAMSSSAGSVSGPAGVPTNSALPDPGAAPMPTWGAGWGRIDRGVAPSNTVNLQDVGHLLP
jgi:MFS transporter, PHS family, inorganic phosphate transporter